MNSSTNTVAIKPSESGQLVNIYQSNDKFGYIMLHTEQIEHGIGWSRMVKRNCLMRGEVAVLEKIASSAKNGLLAGKIVVKEFLESDMPDWFKAQLNKKVTREDAIESFIKRKGQDGPELTVGGERILRMQYYDPTGLVPDEHVQHDREDSAGAEPAAE